MKNKILSVLASLLLSGGVAFADVQMQSAGTNIGNVTKINVSGGLTATRSGQVGTITGTPVSGNVSLTGNVGIGTTYTSGTTLSVGSTSQMTVTSAGNLSTSGTAMFTSGNVGIGTITAAKQLAIGSTGQTSVDSSGNIVGGGTFFNSGNVGIGTVTANKQFKVGSTGQFNVDSSGNTVTTGTAATGALTVTGAASVSSTLAAGATTITGALGASGNLVGATVNYALDTASSDDYTIALAPVSAAYTTGEVIMFKAATANTGACTVNVNGLGVKSLKRGVSTDPGDNYIKVGSIVVAVYDGTNFQFISPAAQ